MSKKFAMMALQRILPILGLVALLFCAAPARAAQPPWATGESRPQDIQIFLMTFSQGDDIASWFGHTALLVTDKSKQAQRVYNFGMFDFGPAMLPSFLMGRLEFWVGEGSAPHTVILYKRLNRDVILTELDLLPQKRAEMAKALAENVLPENRNYLYDHYFDNCATRIRDLIDQAVDGQLKAATDKPARFSLRGHTRRHTQRNPYIDMLLTTWMNDDIDVPIKAWDEMFLPGELYDNIHALEYTDPAGQRRKLAKADVVAYRSTRDAIPSEPSALWPWMLLLGVALGGVAVAFSLGFGRAHGDPAGEKKWVRLLGAHHLVVGLLFGLPGLVLVLFHLTEHTITHLNENNLLLGPITFFALPVGAAMLAGRRGLARWMRVGWYFMTATSLLAALIKVLPFADQDNLPALALFVPFNVLMSVAMHRFGPPAARGELKAITDNVWSVKIRRRFLEVEFGSRMTIVKMRDGGVLLYSPVLLDDMLIDQIDAIGPVEHIIAPNTFHHTYVKQAVTAFPGATLYGPPALREKRPDLEFRKVFDDEPLKQLERDCDWLQIRGMDALQEVVLFHRASKTLLVCDLIGFFADPPRHLWSRVYLSKLAGVVGEPAVPNAVRMSMNDRDAVRGSVEKILEWDFERIIVCHGNGIRKHAKERFRNALAFLGIEPAGPVSGLAADGGDSGELVAVAAPGDEDE